MDRIASSSTFFCSRRLLAYLRRSADNDIFVFFTSYQTEQGKNIMTEVPTRSERSWVESLGTYVDSTASATYFQIPTRANTSTDHDESDDDDSQQIKVKRTQTCQHQSKVTQWKTLLVLLLFTVLFLIGCVVCMYFIAKRGKEEDESFERQQKQNKADNSEQT